MGVDHFQRITKTNTCGFRVETKILFEISY